MNLSITVLPNISISGSQTYTSTELRGLAYKLGNKDASQLNKKELCKSIGIPIIPNFRTGSLKIFKPVKVIFTSIKNGEIVEFESMTKASKAIGGKSSTIIRRCILNKKVFEYMGKHWIASRK